MAYLNSRHISPHTYTLVTTTVYLRQETYNNKQVIQASVLGDLYSGFESFVHSVQNLMGSMKYQTNV